MNMVGMRGVAALSLLIMFLPAVFAEEAVESSPQPSEKSNQALLSESEMEELVEDIRNLNSAAQEALKTFPSDRFDRTAVLEDTDYDADRIFAWIKENTRWVPYQGKLRGANGVLLDRVGNSLDRSLLLSALLQDAGYETRLANARLPVAEAGQLLRALADHGDGPVPIEGIPTSEGRVLAARAADQAAALAQLVNLPTGQWNENLVDTVADHWWVEFKDNSEWRTLDPLLGDQPDSIHPAADNRFQPDKIPASLNHQVTIRIVIERFEQGQLFEEIPLEHFFNTADGPVQDFELFYIPYGYRMAPDETGEDDKIYAVADLSQDWLPVLRTRDEQFIQQGFSRFGKIEPNPAKPAVQRKFDLSQRALGSLGSEELPTDPILSALWIEYQVDQPGELPNVTRRQIFDLLGPARLLSGDIKSFALSEQANRERGLALFTQTRMLITATDVPLVALEKASLELWAHHGHQVAAFVRLLHDPTAEEPLQRLVSKLLPPLDIMSMAAARKEFSRFRNETFLSTPNVLTTHDFLQDGKTIQAAQAVDLVRNSIGATGGKTPLARVRLEQGVLDTVIEAGLPFEAGVIYNTSKAFGERGSSSNQWAVVKESSTLATAEPRAWARMNEAMRAKRTIVAPGEFQNGVQPTWWEIDTATGTTLGIGKNGWGVEMTEDAGTRGVGQGGVKEATQKQGMKVYCKVLQAGGWVDDALSVVAEVEPWFAAGDRALHAWRMNQKWRSQHLRTMEHLDELAKDSCK